MNIYYTKQSLWELDMFKNDIFKNELYNIKINFILFDENTEINNTDKHNVIVANSNVSSVFLEGMIKKLEPSVIFHLSDEGGASHHHYKLYNKYNIKLLFHQYNNLKRHPKTGPVQYTENHFQIPLGYASGFLSGGSSLNVNQQYIIKNKIYDYSFVGSDKSDRKVMLAKFDESFDNKMVRRGGANWGDLTKQRVQPSEMFDIYKKSFFTPIGRGNLSLDCFRLYEAIVAGSIPVIVGDVNEINVRFDFNKKMPNIITGETWDKAASLCKNLRTDKDKMRDIIKLNNKWWRQQIISISEKINKLLCI